MTTLRSFFWVFIVSSLVIFWLVFRDLFRTQLTSWDCFKISLPRKVLTDAYGSLIMFFLSISFSVWWRSIYPVIILHTLIIHNTSVWIWYLIFKKFCVTFWSYQRGRKAKLDISFVVLVCRKLSSCWFKDILPNKFVL